MKKWILGLTIISLIWACGGSDNDGGKDAEKKVADAGNVDDIDGKAVYKMSCAVCHKADGTGGINGSKNLAESSLDLEGRINVVTNGSETNTVMTAFKGILSPKEIKAVALYTMEFK